MTPQEFDAFLKQTLEDEHFSRSEKRSLKELVFEAGATDQQYGFYRHRAFAIAEQALQQHPPDQVLSWLEGVIQALQPATEQDQSIAEAYFTPQDDAPRIISQMIKRASKSIDICVFTITDDRITEAILHAHSQGVPLRIITDDEKAADTGSDILRLHLAGVRIRIDNSPDHMHHKFAIFDKKALLTGSYNWTRSAAHHNLENFIITNENRLLRKYLSAFEQLWHKLNDWT